MSEQNGQLMRALKLAEQVMSYSRGDAWERDCTQTEYDEFMEIYRSFYPPEPAPAEPFFPYQMPVRQEKAQCPECGRNFFNVAEHARAKHPAR